MRPWFNLTLARPVVARFACRYLTASWRAIGALMLCVISALASVRPVRAASALVPYVQIVTGGIPGVIPNGQEVTLFGRDFCGAPGCSPVTVTIGNNIVAAIVVATGVPVGVDGTFSVPFTVNVPFAWGYVVTATQTNASGAHVTAGTPLVVTLSDFEVSSPVPPPAAPITGLSGATPRFPSPHGPDPSSVTEFAPNIADGWDGRSVSVDVSTASSLVVIAASESGGLWKTTDAGTTWSHLDGLPEFRMSAVRMDPNNPMNVIATTWPDSQATSGGGIWRSTDGGTTWAKPTGADPSCSPIFAAWGIAFVVGSNDVFVGTDCGLAVSHDHGGSWAQVVPDILNPPIYGVVAQPGGASGSIVDTCGADGHLRSTDGGATWTSPSAALPGCPYIGVQTIAVSPLEPNVLFAAISNTSLYESDDGGTTWTNVAPPKLGSSREPWVATHLSADSNASHIDVYFGSGLTVVRQTCTNTGGPGLRCSSSGWSSVTIDHADQNGLAFSTANNCAEFIVSDGGIHKTSDCGATWTITGGGTGGYHALQVYEATGETHPASTDLYFGTQDNKLWASGDNGATWPNKVQWEGFFIQVPHSSPSPSGQTVTFVACSGCGNFKSGADFASLANWNNCPGQCSITKVQCVNTAACVTDVCTAGQCSLSSTTSCTTTADCPGNVCVNQGAPFLISPGVYIQWSQPNPPTSQLYLSTDTGGTWNAVTGATLSLQLADKPFVAGPPASPTIYQEVIRPGQVGGVVKMTGVLGGAATITNADTGLNNIGFWSMGQGTFRFAQVFAVDPNNANHLIAADIGNDAMMFSTDGGNSWTADTPLTTLVTRGGAFLFGQPFTTDPGLTTEAHVVAFDPNNGNRILVGTEQAGMILSTDGGSSWNILPGSDQVPAESSFFFDEVQNDIIASSYGRGLWKVSDLTVEADLAVTKSGLPDPVIAGTDLTYTIDFVNNGPSNANSVSVTDATPTNTTFQSIAVQTGTGWNCGGPMVGQTGTVTCTKSPVLPGETASFTLVVHVLSSAANGSTIMNDAQTSSITTDPTSSNNTGPSSTGVVTEADLAVTKHEARSLVIPGKPVEYTIVVTNSGPSDAKDATMTDTLPANTVFEAVSAPAGWICTTPPPGGTGTVTCTVPSLPVGATATFGVVVLVNANLPNGTKITNTVAVSSSSGLPDPTPNNDSALTSAVVYLPVPALGRAALVALILLLAGVAGQSLYRDRSMK